MIGRLAVAVLALCLAGCDRRPLAIVLWPGDSGLVEAVEAAGYRVAVPPAPFNGDLHAWAAQARAPGMFDAWDRDLAQVISDGGGQAVVVGISRGGYLALRAGRLPGVRAVVALSPVTDLSRLSEFEGVAVDPSYRLTRPPVPVFSAIGSDDRRVGTDAAIALLDDIVVIPSVGHNLAGLEEGVAFLAENKLSE